MMIAYSHNPSYMTSWGKVIVWTQEFWIVVNYVNLVSQKFQDQYGELPGLRDNQFV